MKHHMQLLAEEMDFWNARDYKVAYSNATGPKVVEYINILEYFDAMYLDLREYDWASTCFAMGRTESLWVVPGCWGTDGYK